GMPSSQLCAVRHAPSVRAGRGRRIIFDIFEDIARLTVQYMANGVQRTEANRAHLAGFEIREVDIGDADQLRKLVELHLAVCQYAVQTNNNHNVWSTSSCSAMPY